ncbi:MAG: hypothetical protein OHK93_005738 [Ramalina farinacea]|uniref:NEDD8-activating enzyme E1 regulatory subunit n=1 Tax=Ramalina farinacea TaxID=258253 RepID=A0AA43QHA2_9LECA|nr:hypothetical protein [Ramalina farinacea]
MAASATTPPPLQPPSQAPTAKERKYDRQLRLWAASGQQALENAKILLLNSGPGVVGVETLKNLILPGVGSFTIVDEALVEEEDLGVNFFLTEDSLGKSRAEECTTLLRELNPEVEGHGVRTSIDEYVKTLHQERYTLILLIGPSPHVQQLSKYCSKTSIPLFYVHSLGFYSHFSIQLPHQFPIVDTHPDPASTQDLRLLNPWPELSDYAKEKTSNLDSLSDHDHGHIPYLLLLLHYLEEWKASHNDLPPQNYSEKKEFKDLVTAGARTSNPEGGEENYDEAAAANPLSPSTTSSSSSHNPSNFWLIANAISRFHSTHHVLPLPGALPDMKAQSRDYIHLQNIYKSKARQDLAEVIATVRSTEQRLRQNHPNPPNTDAMIDEREIEAFCKGAAFVKLIHGRPLMFANIFDDPQTPGGAKEEEATEWQDSAPSLAMEFHMQEESLLPIYLAFRAYDGIFANPRPRPWLKKPVVAEKQKSMEQHALADLDDIAKMAGLGEKPDTAVLQKNIRDVVAEFVRADGAELHNISALTGGMVAQEVIKVVTKQYVPVDAT